MILSKIELFELTGKKHASAQAEVLNILGINHLIRPDGMLIVSRYHLEQLLGSISNRSKIKNIEPNWNAINAKR